MLAGWMNRQQQQVIEYLLEERRVYKAHCGNKRLKFSDQERRRLALKGKQLGWSEFCEYANIVTPACICAWHRKLVALKWSYPRKTLFRKIQNRHKIRGLVLRFAEENPGWSYGKIEGMVTKCGYQISRSTIRNILHTHRHEPEPEKQKRVNWSTFLKSHWECLAACDFFNVEVWTLKGLVTYKIHFVMDILTREVTITAINCQWNGRIMEQIARHLTDPFDGFLKGKQYLIMDADPLYTQNYCKRLREAGIQPIRNKGAHCNSYAERFVLSIRQECLNHMVIIGEKMLHQVIQEYITYYNEERPHQGVGNQVIKQNAETFENEGLIVKNERLGGLLISYERKVA